MERKLKLAILTGQDSAATCQTVSMLADLPEVEIVSILADVEPLPLKSRLRNLRRNIRREGIGYVWYRLFDFVREAEERLAQRLVSQEKISKVLQESFPERPRCLADLGRQRNIPILHVGNLNRAEAAKALRELDSDLGIVLGTRILKRSTFAAPRMGCINLHKGKVPEYRGMPPGFWELYDSQNSATVTVHMVDDHLDTGDVIGTQSISIHPKDTPATLRKKLDRTGSEVLSRCVAQWAQGKIELRPQRSSTLKARTSPTRRQRRELDAKLGINSDWSASWPYVLKSLLYLAFFYGGIFRLVRAWRKLRGGKRACVLLYHRVNDQSEDPLTTSIEHFAEQMAVLQRYYEVVPTSWIVEAAKTGRRLPDHSIAIHFDDCYQDVYTNASRILAQMRFPACCFISSGYVETDRIFPHDAEKCPFPMPNLTVEDLLGLTRRGFSVGAHTVTHADLGQCSYEQAIYEVVESKNDLEKYLHCIIPFFSYPYGEKKNIRDEVVELVRQSGYQALFSAYGGYFDAKSDLYDVPRWSVSSRFRPLDLLMEIEGLSISAFKRRWTAALSRRGKVEKRAIQVPLRERRELTDNKRA